MTYQEITELIKAEIKKQKISKNALAIKSGLSRTPIDAILMGMGVDSRSLVKICDSLGMKISVKYR